MVSRISGYFVVSQLYTKQIFPPVAQNNAGAEPSLKQEVIFSTAPKEIEQIPSLILCH
jgi:hypothetical protein